MANGLGIRCLRCHVHILGQMQNEKQPCRRLGAARLLTSRRGLMRSLNVRYPPTAAENRTWRKVQVGPIADMLLWPACLFWQARLSHPICVSSHVFRTT